MNTRRIKAHVYREQSQGGEGGGGGGQGQQQQGQQQGHGIAWLPADADAELVGHVQSKAWTSAADAVKGARSLEQLLGADRAGRTVIVPKDDADADGWATVYDRLGRPATPEAYKLPVPEGQGGEFATAAAAQFHKLGITAKQGQALAAWWNEQAQVAAQAQEARDAAALEQEHAALARDWGTGDAAAVQRELARRAATSLGLDEASVAALEKVAGFSKTMKAFAKVGEMLREHEVEGFGDGGQFGQTPEMAKARKAQLMADADWRSKAMNPNSAEWAELQKLDKVINAHLL